MKKQITKKDLMAMKLHDSQDLIKEVRTSDDGSATGAVGKEVMRVPGGWEYTTIVVAGPRMVLTTTFVPEPASWEGMAE